MIMMRERRDVRPVLLKFGVALALSLGGIFYSFLRIKRIKPSQSPPSPPPSDSGNQADSGGEIGGLKSNSCDNASIESEKHEELSLSKINTENTISSLSPKSNNSGDKDVYLLPEFHELMKEFDLASDSPRKDVETPKSDVDSPRGYKFAERNNYYEQEIKNLKSMVNNLRERERNLEIQLLEYYGLKEQETAVMELQNRLKINNMEAKLFTLKIESLQADNRRLEAQVSDYAKVVGELETARAKIKILKKKLRFEAEQNREQILTLQQRVMKLKDQELKDVSSDVDVQLKLQKLKDLEAEAEELRKSNYSLRMENSSLAQRLESTQVLATSILEDQETEALKEECCRLRRENDDFAKEIEQLQADRCVDAEELVYLKWINACLRYELRNFQPGPGKTVAKDLSKTLSPKSEEKAKQLILEYATKEGSGEKGISVIDFDSDRWSSSQASFLTDSGELDDSSVDNSSANKTHNSSKTKFFGKLRRLLRGKDHHHDHDHTRDSSLETIACIEDMAHIYSGDSPQGDSGISAGTDRPDLSRGSSKHSSLDLQRLRSVKFEDIKDLESLRRNSDVGSSGIYKRIVSSREGIAESPLENQIVEDSESVQRTELFKYADVLRDSRGTTSKFRRRSASYRSF